MLSIIVVYVASITMIHMLLFTRAGYVSRILLINSAISCIVIAMLLLSYYFKDTNFIDVIFFYIIMSPIGFYGLFLYYKNTGKNLEQNILKNQNNQINSKNNEKILKKTNKYLKKDANSKQKNKF